MDFVKESKVEAGWTLGFEPDGRELLVVAVKATFLIPKDGAEAPLAEEQVPLTEADEFTGEPGLSAVLYETDYAHRKPYCDVLLNGSAYAPGGKPTDKVQVALQVGKMYKSFNVVGDRVWDRFMLNTSSTLPLKYLIKKISYDTAYGGVDSDQKDPSIQKTYLKNPVGVGYYPISKGKDLHGKPLPNTEQIGRSVTSTTGDYNPMSFGPIGRNFASRYPFAGTYDQKWLDSRAPFWPDDFDYRYFQAAPTDQQIPYPSGGEQVVLRNLTPQGRTMFLLPRIELPILVLPYREKEQELKPALDTVLLEPDKSRFMLTWRMSFPLRKNCFEIRQVVVGKSLAEYRRRIRSASKPHRSIRELVSARLRRKATVK